MALRPPVVVFAVVVEIFVTMTTGLGDKLVMFIRFTQSILFTHTHTRTLLSLNCDQEEKARKPERTDPLQWQWVWNLLPSCHPLQGHAASADKALARVIWNNPWSVLRLWSTVGRRMSEERCAKWKFSGIGQFVRNITAEGKNVPLGSSRSISRNVDLTLSWQYPWGRFYLFIYFKR